MRSLTLAARAAPGVGGQGVNLALMANGLREAFDLRVYCSPPGTGFPGGTVDRSRLAALVGGAPLLRRRRDWVTSADDRHFDRIVAARLQRTDIFQGVTGQCLESLRAARRLGARTVVDSVTQHVGQLGAAMDASCGAFGIRPPLGAAWRRRAEQEYREADIIRVPAEAARRSFVERGVDGSRVVTVPMWFEGPAREPGPRPDHFHVGYVGLLEPWKGFQHLVEAFSRLGDRDARLTLWGGSGSRPVRRYLQEAAARDPRIAVRPVSDVGGVEAAYRASSVLVLPSLSDGFGLVVAEAMNCGVPVIVSTAAGVSEHVTDGVEGYVVAPGDVSALTDRLAHLGAHPALLAEMGDAARRRAATLSVEAFRARYIPILEGLAG